MQSDQPDKCLCVCVSVMKANNDREYVHLCLDNYSKASDVKREFGSECEGIIDCLKRIDSKITDILAE